MGIYHRSGKNYFLGQHHHLGVELFWSFQTKQYLDGNQCEVGTILFGKMGHQMEPVIAPLGYDWKMGVGIITSFAAREVFVGTMATLYSLDDEAPEGNIITKMRNDRKPDGEKVFSFATGISILVYYAFAMQCISTIAVVYRETKSMKWTIIQLVFMSGLAYLASLIVYQLLK